MSDFFLLRLLIQIKCKLKVFFKCVQSKGDKPRKEKKKQVQKDSFIVRFYFIDEKDRH